MNENPRFCPQCATPLTPRDHEGISRLSCPRCDYVYWNNPTPVVAAIVEHQGQIVLARNALWPPEMFALVTGFLEHDDPDLASGVLREVEEELGLRGEVAAFVGHYAFPRMNQLIIAYHVIAHGEIKLDAELAESRHVPFNQLRPWPGATGDALRDWMLARGLSPLPYRPEPLLAIRGYHRIDRQLAVSGQPEPLQFKALRFGGFVSIIHLDSGRDAQASAAERQQIEALGMRYLHLPVKSASPDDDTLVRQFVELMDAEAERRVLIHGTDAAFATVLAYLYCVIRRQLDLDTALTQLEQMQVLNTDRRTFMQCQLEHFGLADTTRLQQSASSEHGEQQE